MARIPKECCGSLGAFHRKGCPQVFSNAVKPQNAEIAAQKESDEVPLKELNKEFLNETETKFLERIAELEKINQEHEKKFKMLYAVADKSRVFNYENANKEKKSFKVSLSMYEGSVIIGWRTIKDVLRKNPTTGKTVGEEQQYEVLLLSQEGSIVKRIVDGYVAFSDMRYSQRIECEVVGKKENSSSGVTYDVQLPDGRLIQLDSKFVN